MDCEYVSALSIWFEELGAKRFATFLNGGVVARLHDEKFTDLLEVWRVTLGNGGFVTFIIDG